MTGGGGEALLTWTNHDQSWTACNILLLKFWSYCQVSEHVEPRNSLASRMRAAIVMDNSGNLTDGQMFLASDTGKAITKFQWTELPMKATVIERVNLIGKDKPSILTFINRHGQEIGDST